MKLTLKHALATIILVLSFGASVAAGPFEDGVEAQERGDQAAAIRLLRPLAVEGNADAQSWLGSAYESAANYVKAAKWYRSAADQGHSVAQLFLSVLYASGIGVPQDYVLAHMWNNLALFKAQPTTSLFTEAIKRREALASKMTPAQIAEAQKLAREWKPTKQPPR